MTTTNAPALMKYAGATPARAMSSPAAAGPAMRATLKAAELSATALATSVRPASSTTNACRTGKSTVLAIPHTMASTHTCQYRTWPVTMSVGQRQRLATEQRLRDHEQPPLGQTIGDGAADDREEEDGQEVQTADE